jgi:NMD protein affecting ribosome stability and mRNA decay
MTKIEEIKESTEEEIRKLSRKRSELIIELDKVSKDINTSLEKLYALEPSMVAIKCPACQGKGYIESNDGNKQICSTCGGPDKPYIWAEKYESGKPSA